MKQYNPEYKIVFGKGEKKSKGSGYNNMTVTLNLSASDDGAHAGIHFEINEGYPEGQFDMNRSEASKGISIEEAKQLVSKLNCFISRAEQFLEQYKHQ